MLKIHPHLEVIGGELYIIGVRRVKSYTPSSNQ
jgi:hypothetical protein